MAAPVKDSTGELLVVGINHRSASPALRERLFVQPPDPAALLAPLRAAGLDEAVVLATCERIELLAPAPDAGFARSTFLESLGRIAGIAPAELADHCFEQQGSAALRHIFAVTAALDSQMLGEPQVLGQVKECHRRAVQAGMVSPALEAVLQAAYAAAKRVRRETPLARQPVSIAAAALMVARDVHGELARRRALLIGLGEMGEFMARELLDAGVGSLAVVHPSLERARGAAARLGCHFRPWAELEEALAGADIVVAAQGSGGYAITAAQAEAALKRRRREAIFFIDTALPCDLDPAVAPLDGAFVYSLEDLERVALRGKASRAAATSAAWRILGEEVSAFLRQRAERAAAPAVTALRRQFEAARREVLAESRLDAAEATRLLVNRLLHDPSEALRTAAAEAHPDEQPHLSLERALRRLFRLGRSERPGDEEEDDT